jgi:hypothetical protein
MRMGMKGFDFFFSINFFSYMKKGQEGKERDLFLFVGVESISDGS